MAEEKESRENEPTILQLENHIKRMLRKDLTPKQRKKLNELKRSRLKQKSHNRSIGSKKGAITKRGRKEGLSQKKINEQKERLGPTFDLRRIDNQVKAISKKDFYYNISDGFNDTYKIKLPALARLGELPLQILRKFKRKVKEGLLQYEAAGETNRARVMKKILDNVDFNINVLKGGEKKYPDDMDSARGEYPIYVFVTPDLIQVFV